MGATPKYGCLTAGMQSYAKAKYADSLSYEHRKTVRFLTDPHSLPQVQLLDPPVGRNALEY
jgi:hypothetical protein